MHSEDTAAADLRSYFETGYLPVNGHATSIAALVLATMPFTQSAPGDAEDDDALFVPTDDGLALTARWRAEVVLYGREIS